MSKNDSNLKVAIINAVIALLQLIVGIIVIPQVQQIIAPSSSLVFNSQVPFRPAFTSLNLLAEDILWVIFFSLGYAAAWALLLGIVLIGWLLIKPLPDDVSLRKIVPIGLYSLWILGAVLAVFIRTHGTPPVGLVILAVETQIVGILIGVGVGILLLLLVLIIGIAGNFYSSPFPLLLIGLSILAPIIGSILGSWYGVYG